jgi:hypothetical protein
MKRAASEEFGFSEDPDDAIDLMLDLMQTRRKWPSLSRRAAGCNVVDLVGVDPPKDLPGHHVILRRLLLFAVKDRATEVRFEPWRFVGDECVGVESELGIRLFYEVAGELVELVPPPHFLCLISLVKLRRWRS